MTIRVPTSYGHQVIEVSDALLAQARLVAAEMDVPVGTVMEFAVSAVIRGLESGVAPTAESLNRDWVEFRRRPAGGKPGAAKCRTRLRRKT